MPSESLSPNPKPSYRSLESLKQTFKQRLDAILYKQLAVDNIDTFANEALEKLTALTKDILEQYGTTEALEPANLALKTGEQEDDAFKKLGLPNIQEILQRVIEVKNKIDNIKTYISEPKNVANEVIIPPQHDSPSEIKGNSDQGIKEKKLVPRLITLLYILETDFDIKKEQVKITEGKVTPEMVRRTPYVRVEIPDMERIVYICDEEGNASYVFDAEKLKEIGITLEKLDVSDKGEINNLIAQHPCIGSRIIQTKNWRTNMAEILYNPIPENYIQVEQSERPVSEFKRARKEKREILIFEEFQKEVKALYPRQGDISKWYGSESKNHPSWPSRPNKIYKENWTDWPDLVGKENRLKIKYLSFMDFQTEVRSLYPKKGDVKKWYTKERKNHTNWPADPDKNYEEKGWQGWPELVSIENRLKIKYLSFMDFQTEVKSKYPGQRGVYNWYREEKENHTNWPAAPNRTYKDRGWTSWPELVGKNKE